MMFVSCGRHDPKRPRAAYLPLAQFETVWPPDYSRKPPYAGPEWTGDRVGLFLDASGAVWGLPLAVENGGEVLGCAPNELRRARVTDT